MTRPTKRDLERRVSNLDDDKDTELKVTISRVVPMPREEAERKGYQIVAESADGEVWAEYTPERSK